MADEPYLTAKDRQFLDRPRIGFLTVAPKDEWPVPVPLWFERADNAVQLFTSRRSKKARRIQETPRASLLAANEVGEPEYWVAVTGPASIETDGANELAVRLAARYWDLDVPALAAVRDGWRSDESLVRVVIRAEQVTRYKE